MIEKLDKDTLNLLKNVNKDFEEAKKKLQDSIKAERQRSEIRPVHDMSQYWDHREREEKKEQHSLRLLEIAERSLKLAEESNKIAENSLKESEKSNQIADKSLKESEKSNKKADSSNHVAIGSLVISILSLAFALHVSFQK